MPDPIVWKKENLPTCPKCLKPVQAVASEVDNLNRRLLVGVVCHDTEINVILTFENLAHTKKSAKNLLQGLLPGAFGSFQHSVPQAVAERLKTAAQAEIYKRPTRKINLTE